MNLFDSLLRRSLYAISYFVGWMLVGIPFPVRASGVGVVPKDGPVLILSNHQSFLDPLLLGITSPRRLWFLARSSLFENRLLGWYLGNTAALPIDREGFGKRGIRAGLDVLENDGALAIFPEGTRTRTGQLGPIKKGIFVLVRRSKAPVVLAGIAGAYESFPPEAKLPRRRAIRVHFACWKYEESRTPQENLESLETALTRAIGEADRRRRTSRPPVSPASERKSHPDS